MIQRSFFRLVLNYHLKKRGSWWNSLRRTLMYSPRMPMRPREWIHASYAIIWMSVHQSPPRSNLLDVHLRNTLNVVKDKVVKLKQARAIKEVFYLEWLANTVVVKKKTGIWRVCVDFTDLNKACPKDPFPMPQIDQLVDATVGHPWMSFLDAFQGYHQIPLAVDD